MKLDKSQLLLYAVTDRRWLNGKTLASQVESVIRGGATCIQLREKGLDDKAFLDEAFEIKDICRSYNVPLIINDNAEVAVKCKADGIHVGQHDMNAAELRKFVGNDMIIGVSASTIEEAVEAEKNSADYIGTGAVFGTSTKDDAEDVGYDMLTEICRTVSIPVVAIGGITENNISKLAGSGIVGVAVVSALFAKDNPEAAASVLRKLAERTVNGK